MTVQALTSFTYKDNVLSMYAGEVADVDSTIGADLISEGYVKEYSEGGSGGYDIDIFVDASMDSATTDNSQILSGSYASVREKLINGEAVQGILHCAYDYNETGHNDTAEMFYLSLVSEVENGILSLVFFRMSAGITTQMVNSQFAVSVVTLTEDGIDSINYSTKTV